VGTWDTKTFELRGYYLQAPDCVAILCAAEVLAALRGRPCPDLPDEVREWVGVHRRLDVTPLLAMAIAKVDRVLAAHSELDELWKENEADYPTWRAGVDDLRSRLGQ